FILLVVIFMLASSCNDLAEPCDNIVGGLLMGNDFKSAKLEEIFEDGSISISFLNHSGDTIKMFRQVENDSLIGYYQIDDKKEINGKHFLLDQDCRLLVSGKYRNNAKDTIFTYYYSGEKVAMKKQHYSHDTMIGHYSEHDSLGRLLYYCLFHPREKGCVYSIEYDSSGAIIDEGGVPWFVILGGEEVTKKGEMSQNNIYIASSPGIEVNVSVKSPSKDTADYAFSYVSDEILFLGIRFKVPGKFIVPLRIDIDSDFRGTETVYKDLVFEVEE
ncbi:MAG: hypothetical protein AAGI38_24190, partial [Bacteroidota bacterium]